MRRETYRTSAGQQLAGRFILFTTICMHCHRNFGEHFGAKCWNDGRTDVFAQYPSMLSLPEGI